MLAERKLAELARRKLLLEARIAVRRLECLEAGAQLAPPIAFVDRAWRLWLRLSPWVKALGVPLGALVAGKFAKPHGAAAGGGRLATLLGLLPVVIEIWKGFNARQRPPTEG